MSQRGIEIDLAKIKAINVMPVPRTEKEVRGFLERINYKDHFIAKLYTTCELLFKMLRKNDQMRWNDDCQVE